MSNELETQIEDDLLKDKFSNFFKKNKIIVFVSLLLLIVLPISVQIFFFYNDKKQEQLISKYIEAEILIDKNDIKGVQILNTIKDKGNDTIKLLTISKLAEYHINNDQKDKALEILSNNKVFDNSMFEELTEIKKVILNFDRITENEIINLTKNKKNKDNFKLLKTKLLYDYYIKSNQLEKAKQLQRNFK
tara:strand:+ start:173 stop:742 length:570 start_codon:yes stop_codon:yes gene_type:complete